MIFSTNVAAQKIEVGDRDIDLNKTKSIKKDITDRFKGKAVKITGGINLNSVYTQRRTGASNTQPLTYMANGNIGISIYQFKLGANFSYSNHKFSYSHSNPSFSFNRLALRPRYKNFASQIGDASVSFSPYTLSGVQFRGAAIEYTPKKFKVQALYGRFMKAVTEDSITQVKPSYKRMGWGAKTVYQQNGRKLGAALFHARDNIFSIPQPVLARNKEIQPMEGTAVQLEAGWPVFTKKLTVNVDYALSILTQDLRYNDKNAATDKQLLHYLVRTANPTTSVYKAIKAGFNYSQAGTGVGVAYERVDPDYRTLGAYYFTNDFENVTVNISQSLFKQKVTVGINTGVQHDDLKNTKASNMKRIVLAGNVNILASKKMNIATTYSNFTSYTNIRSQFDQVNQATPYENLDTLDFTQLSQNAGITVNHQLVQGKKQAQGINIAVNGMETANQKGGVSYKGDVTRFINASVSHSLQFIPCELTIASGFMYSFNYAALQSSSAWGPSLNITKSLFEKTMRTNIGATYNVATNHLATTSVLNIRAGATALLKKKHNINCTFLCQKRIAKETDQFLTGTLGYSFNF